jgi:hypothetical protein
MNLQSTTRVFDSTGTLRFSDASVVDDLDLHDLLKQTRQFFSAIDTQPPPATASIYEQLSVLDKVYVVKVARRLSESHLDQDTRELTYHFQALLGDSYWDSCVGSELRQFKSRWEALVDVLQASLRIVKYSKETTTRHLHHYSNVAPDAWYWVANEVRAREHGIGWSDLFSLANTKANAVWANGVSKSKFSGIVAAMRLAGWLRVVSHGRSKTLHLGYAAALRDNRPDRGAHEDSEITAGNNGEPTDLKLVRDVVCGLSGAFLSFMMLGSEKHKTLRTAESVSEKKNAVAELYGFLSAQTNAVAHASFAYLDQYFDRTPRKGNSDRPRISVKVVQFDESDSSSVWVVDFARNHVGRGNSLKTLSSSNTGFQRVEETGRPYLSNDLPREIFAGRYSNPRIRLDLVNEFCNSSSIRGADDLSPLQWRSLWKGAEDACDYSAAYKSTLIVPITLRNNRADPQFVDLLARMADETNHARKCKLQSIDRTILGYLCFDHPDTNFFCSADEHIGYVIADWLSMFLMVRYAYTTLSTSFTKATTDASTSQDTYNALLSIAKETQLRTMRDAQASIGVWTSPSPPRRGLHQPMGLGSFDVDMLRQAEAQ